MRIKTLSLIVSLGVLSLTAGNAFVVKSIRFTGLERIAASNVQADVPVLVGDDINESDTNAIIEDIFKTGYFSDVKIYNDNGNLIIHVKELPTIAKIDISGNEMIKSDDLKKGLLSAGLQVGNIYSSGLVRQIQSSLQQEYNKQGKYAVQVNMVVTPVSDNRVNVEVKISEGLTAKINRINIVGNHVFSSDELRKHITLTTPGLLSFFNGNDKYSADKMNQTLKELTDYYQNRGYLNMRVNSTQVSLDTTHTKTFITLNITEGERYQFAGFKIIGNTIVPLAQVLKLVHIKAGDTYSRQTVLDVQKTISDLLGNRGYAFANINPVPTVDDAKKTVFINFYVTPNQKVLVRDINFNGNTVTNDKALRQRMRFVEGSTYSSEGIDTSKIALERLPYIQNVTQTTTPVSGTSDQADINYNLVEKSANSVSGNIGYSELFGVLLGLGFSVPNVFGTGNIFSINTQISRPYQNVSVDFMQPYFTQNGVSQDLNFYFTRVDAAEEGLASYSTNSVGATLNYGVPISTWNSFTFGGGVDRTILQPPSDSQSLTVSDFMQQHGSGYNTFTLNLGLSRDSTNNAYFPTLGEKASALATVAMPGSSLNWYKLTTGGIWYHSVTRSITFSAAAGAGFGSGYGNTKHLPFFNNFYGGGWDSTPMGIPFGNVRGYSAGTLGPQDTIVCTDPSVCSLGSASQGQAVGGNLSVNFNFELYFPMPFVTDMDSLKLLTFFDAGNVYNTYKSDVVSFPNMTSPMPTTWNDSAMPNTPNLGNLRYSLGVGVEWASPLGEMAVSFAKPLNVQQGDDTQIFQFSIGTFF